MTDYQNLLHVFGYHSLARQCAMKDNVVQQTFQDVCKQPCFHLERVARICEHK